ncbi:phage tail spike protein [Bacillus cereus]|nr:phage tail spike protein [Bacillus cereus]
MANKDPNMIIVTDPYGRQKTILTNSLPKTPRFFDDGHQEQLDGLLTYQFATLASDPDTKHLQAGNNVIVRNKDRKLMLFTIIRTREERRDGKYVRTVFAENAAVDDLYNTIVKGEKLVSISAQDAATKVLEGTGWKLGIIDYAGLQNVDLSEYPTALAALHKIRDIYGLEMEFTVNFIGTQVRERFVHLVKKRGQVTGKRFTYAKDLIGVSREEDRSDLATAIIPVGKADEKGNRLTMEEFENIHDGYVSPKGQTWVGDDNALQQFGKNGKHLFKRLDLSSADNQYLLMQEAVAELRRCMKPRLTYEVSVLLLEQLTGYEHEKVRLGDTILVKDTTFDPALAVQARVIEIYRSYTDPTKDHVVLGEFVPLVIDKNKQIEAIQETINQNMSKWEQGGEVVYKNVNEPPLADRKPDMLWLDLSAKPNVMRRWDAENKRWVNASATTAAEVGAETPKGAQDKANKAEETAIAEAAEDAAIKAKQAEDNAVEKAEEMDEEIKIELKSYVEGLTEEVEAAVKEHADQVAKDAELNAQIFTEGYAQKEFHYGETPPKDTTQLWFDLSSNPNKIRRYDEASKTWVAASPTSPSDIGAASVQETIDEANRAREEAIKKAKEEASQAKKDAIAEAKELDKAIKSEAERLSQAAEEAAKGHADDITKQVEEALKQDSQNKADQAKEGALSEADKRIQTAKKEAEQNAKKEAEALAEAARKKAEEAAAADAKKKADAAQKAAEDAAAKELSDRLAGLSNVGRNLLLGTKDKKHIVKNGENINHSYFTFVDNAIKDIQGKPLTVALKLSGKVATIGTTNPWIGMEVRIDYTDGTSQYISGRGEKIIKPNVEYNRLLLSGTGTVFDKPIKSLSAYALARDFTGGTITLEEFKVGIGTQATDYDQPREEELQEVRDTIGSASGQNLALNSAAKLGWIGWSATQAGVKDKWSIVDINELAGFTKAFRIDNRSAVSAAENFLINTIPVANIRILGEKVQFGGWIYNRSMTTGGIRFYARFRGKNAAGAEVLKYANAGEANDIRGVGWTWVTFEFNDWAGMTSLDEVRITANCLKGSNGEAWITGVMMKVSEVSSQWTPSPLDFEELASDAGVLTKGTLAAERLYGQTIDGNKANFVNLNASNISTGTLNADRIAANSINASKIAAGSITADKVAANAITTDKIAASAVNASKIAAGSVTAEKVAANAITADKVSASAITTDKLHVLAKSLVANTSLTGNDSTGWNISKHATSTVGLRGSANMGDVLVHGFTTAEHETPTLYNSNYFEVDPNQTYKFSIGMFLDKNPRDCAQYFGFNAYDKNFKEIPVYFVNANGTSIDPTERTNPYFWSGNAVSSQWRNMDGYVMSSQGQANECPAGRNVNTNFKMHPATKYLRMRFYSGYYPKVKNAAMEVLWHSPSVTAVDSGTIIADTIVTGTLDASKVNVKNINAGNITTGGMSADRISSGTIDARKITVIGLNASNIVAGTINAATIDITNIKAQNITSGIISADRIGANAINADKIAANAVTVTKIYAGAVTAEKIATNAVTADKIIANAVTADKIAANAVTAAKIAAGNITADKIAAGSITTDKIAAAGITADKITSGVLDANRVQVKNLNASVITAGTMSADRITGGTINATNTNIINLKAQNIASGTINADNVAISNGRVTINKDGVTVTDADFLVKDAKTGLLHTTLTSTNLLYDHSFELLKSSGNSPIGSYYLDIDWTSISPVINDSFYKWARVGTPKMIDALGYDVPTEAAPFGLRSGLFNQSNYVVQRFGATAGRQYTISFHAGKPYGGLAAGAPRLIIEHMKDDTVVASETKDFAVPNANVGEVVRYGATITANAGIAGGRTSSIRVRFLTTNANWCAFDGVQAVTGNRAAPYDADDSFWKFSQQRLSPPYINAGTIYANRMEADTYDFKYLRGHKQRNILIDHKNNNVTLSAADGNLHLGYEHTQQVFVNSLFMPQKGINIQGKNTTGNAMDAAGNINTWGGNIKAQDGDILTNWAVKAAGFTFMQHNTPIWAGEGTMWYGWQGATMGLWIFAGGAFRLIWENKWTSG